MCTSSNCKLTDKPAADGGAGTPPCGQAQAEDGTGAAGLAAACRLLAELKEKLDAMVAKQKPRAVTVYETIDMGRHEIEEFNRTHGLVGIIAVDVSKFLVKRVTDDTGTREVPLKKRRRKT